MSIEMRPVKQRWCAHVAMTAPVQTGVNRLSLFVAKPALVTIITTVAIAPKGDDG